MSGDGVVIITARRFRTQEANRRDPRERLAAMLARAAQVPRARRPTRPSPAAPLTSGGCRGKRGAQPLNTSVPSLTTST